MISQTATVLILYPILILTQMIDSSSHLCYNFHEKQTRHKSRARSFPEFARHKDVFGVRLIYTAIRREESYRVLPASLPQTAYISLLFRYVLRQTIRKGERSYLLSDGKCLRDMCIWNFILKTGDNARFGYRKKQDNLLTIRLTENTVWTHLR